MLKEHVSQGSFFRQNGKPDSKWLNQKGLYWLTEPENPNSSAHPRPSRARLCLSGPHPRWRWWEGSQDNSASSTCSFSCHISLLLSGLPT